MKTGLEMVVFLLLLFSGSGAYAQLVEVSPHTRPPQPAEDVVPASPAVLKILPDADCTIYIDGENKGRAAAGNLLRVPLVKGSYMLKAVGINPADVFSQPFHVDMPGTEVLLEVKLQQLINIRVNAEAQNNYTKTNEETELSKRIAMVTIPGGSFEMGSNDGNPDERPVHRVNVNTFQMGVFEVTQAQWVAVMGENPSHFQDCDDCPVESVSWDDVQEFIKRLNQKTGKNYRLPTEAEWEFAAGGGRKGRHTVFSGSNTINAVGWYVTNSQGLTHPGGKKNPNEFGLYDMTGNVWEWCQDWYSADYYASSVADNPQGPSSGKNKVFKGGGWFNNERRCRIAARDSNPPDGAYNYLGFRLVLTP
jgi:formylglycine-generating enzyme required for sulfatase activity